MGNVLAFGQNLTLAWDPSPSPDVAGYRIAYGLVGSGVVKTRNAGKLATYAFPEPLAAGDYFFYVTAYTPAGLESDPSNTVYHSVGSAASPTWNGTILNATPRPRVAATVLELDNFRQAAATTDGAAAAFGLLLTESQAAAATGYGSLPGVGSSDHLNKAAGILASAMAGRLANRNDLMNSAADGLVAYANLYRTVPWTSGLGRLMPTSAYDEARWFIPLVEAYDLLADAGVLTAAERSLIENSLIRSAIPVFRVDDYETDPRSYQLYKSSGHHAYHLAAVGLAGLALGDAALVDWAVNHPYGFRYFVGHVLRDDGVHWERSVTYHRSALAPLIRFTEAAYRCGLDLYGIRTQGMAELVVENHYSTDVTALPKGLKMAFEALPQLQLPDGSYPFFGDGESYWLRTAEQDLVGLRRYRTPALAWHAERNGLFETGSRPDWRTMLTLASMGGVSQYRTLARQWTWADGTFANSGQLRGGSSLLPSTGISVLREKTGVGDRQGTVAALSFGPYGGGHGHAAQLGMVLYAGGRQWVPQFATARYGTPEKGGWTTHTISHNTVVVGKISQNPVGTSTVEWPSDSSSKRVQGRWVQFDGARRRVVAESGTAYPGLTLRRVQQLSGHHLVDDFTVEPAGGTATPRSFDYALHIEGQYDSSSFDLATTSGALGVNSGYQYVQKRLTGTVSEPGWVNYRWADQQLKVWVVPTPGKSCQLILGDGPSESISRRVPMLILSSTGESAAFTTVFEESAGAVETLVEARIKDQLLTLIYGSRSTTVTLGQRWAGTPPDDPPDSVPEAVADVFTTPVNTALTDDLGANDLLSIDGGHLWWLWSTPANGTVVVNGDGTFRYTPRANFSGTDRFTYALRDRTLDQSNAEVRITVIDAVPNVDGPVAVADVFTVDEDTVLTGDLAANDSASADGGNVWSLANAPARGAATVSPNGTFTYRGNWHVNGSDAFTYQIRDADGDVSSATVSIRINPVNDVPVAVADVVTTTRNTPVSGNLATNDLFSGDGGNYLALVSAPANGTATVNPNGTFTYTPKLNFAGTDLFTYQLQDRDGDISIASVSITITPGP